MKIGNKVTVKKGTPVGMKSLRFDTTATVTHIDEDKAGNMICRVEWVDAKFGKKSTWIKVD